MIAFILAFAFIFAPNMNQIRADIADFVFSIRYYFNIGTDEDATQINGYKSMFIFRENTPYILIFDAIAKFANDYATQFQPSKYQVLAYDTKNKFIEHLIEKHFNFLDNIPINNFGQKLEYSPAYYCYNVTALIEARKSPIGDYKYFQSFRVEITKNIMEIFEAVFLVSQVMNCNERSFNRDLKFLKSQIISLAIASGVNEVNSIDPFRAQLMRQNNTDSGYLWFPPVKLNNA